MAVHVPPAPDVHEHVEDEGVAAAEFLDELVVRPALVYRDVQRVGLLFFRPLLHHRQNFAIGGLTDSIEQRGHHFVERMVRLDQVDRLCRSPGGRVVETGAFERFLGITRHVGIDSGLIGAGLRIAREGGRQGFIGPGRLTRQFSPDIDRRTLTGFPQLLPDRLQLRHLRRQEPRNLFLQRPDADHLADVRPDGQG